MHVRLLHGLGADRRAFQRFERLLPAGWQIESLDLLGHGDAPKPAHGYALSDLADHTASQLDAVGEPVVLVGHSYGAATSVAVAARRPELVTGIVLLDPVVYLDPTQVGERMQRMFDARRTGAMATTVAELFPEASPALQRWTAETWERMAVGVIDEFDPNWTPLAQLVTCPVAVVHGEERLGGAGDVAADWFDDPLVTCIAGAGHYLHASHARETAAAVTLAAARSASQQPSHGD